MSGSKANERRDVRFRGHVQGVGFRYTTQALARRLPVTGYVQNLRNGDVRLVVEGAAGDVDMLIEAVRQHLREYIEEAVVDRGSATGEFRDFRIRFDG